MTDEKKKQIYAALSAPFPAEAIQRTDARDTGKGYSTSGIGYQHVVNRLNEVLGIGGFRVSRMLTVRETKTNSGRPSFEAIAEVQLALGEWVDGSIHSVRRGHWRRRAHVDVGSRREKGRVHERSQEGGGALRLWPTGLRGEPRRRQPPRAARTRARRPEPAQRSTAERAQLAGAAARLGQVAFRDRVKRDFGVAAGVPHQ